MSECVFLIGASADFFTDTNAIQDASRSIPEWIASEMILTDPSANPTTRFRMTSTEFDITERRAVFLFPE